MRFWTSDTHFGHANIIKYCNRPFADVYAMDAELIWRWNQVVKPEDEVFHLGDFAFANRNRVEDLLSKLNGRKFLVAGNHDPKGTINANGWTGVYAMETILLGNQVRAEMIHNPAKASGTWKLILHGHQHGFTTSLHDFNPNPEYKYIDCGVDAGWSYTPVSEDQIIERVRSL